MGRVDPPTPYISQSDVAANVKQRDVDFKFQERDF